MCHASRHPQQDDCIGSWLYLASGKTAAREHACHRCAGRQRCQGGRSEEHTSELQSLILYSYLHPLSLPDALPICSEKDTPATEVGIDGNVLRSPVASIPFL